MSSNKQHIQIDRTNYEEAFLLYVDGELTPKGADAVEAFVAAHPDLGEELDALLTTKLDGETLPFHFKESLLAENMQAGIIDEPLLTYVDGELKPDEKKNVEKRIAADKNYSLQFGLLQRAKLDAGEVILYPYKKELYRHEERAVRPMFWMRVAVAVILILGVSIFWWVGNNNNTTIEPVVATVPDKINPSKGPKARPSDKTPEAANIIAQDKQPLTETNISNEPVNQVAQSPRKKNEPAVATVGKPTKHLADPVQSIQPDPRDRIIATIHVPKIDEASPVDALTKKPSQQIINTPAVTTTIAEPYNNQKEATNETGVIYASNNSNDKQGSLRGFLRKASRFIERRTGINPVNEDDKLLIGVVAIKL